MVAVAPASMRPLQATWPGKPRGGGHRHRPLYRYGRPGSEATRAAPAPSWTCRSWRRSSRPGSSKREWLPPEMRLTEPVLGEPEDHRDCCWPCWTAPISAPGSGSPASTTTKSRGPACSNPWSAEAAPVPGDAAVLRPRPDSPRGLALSLALNPAYSQIDTYHMTAVTIDEAVRRLLAVGGDLGHIGGVDNFCWPSVEYHPENNPDGKFKAAQLVRACLALKDLCLAYEMPLAVRQGQHVRGRRAARGASGRCTGCRGLPTLFFTAVSVLPDLTPGPEPGVEAARRPHLPGGRHPARIGRLGVLRTPGLCGAERPPGPPRGLSRLLPPLSRARPETVLASCPRHLPGRAGGAPGPVQPGRGSGD